MTREHGFAGPWISFGGSYSGSLSTWAREKYPHLVKGSVSSSGPLNAKVIVDSKIIMLNRYKINCHVNCFDTNWI